MLGKEAGSDSRGVALRWSGTLRSAVSRLLAPIVRQALEVLPPEMALDWRTRTPNDVTREALRVVVTLGVPDLLRDGKVPIDELAARVGADPDALARVLAHLVRVGLFSAPSAGTIALNRVSRTCLLSGTPGGRAAEFHEDGVGPRLETALASMLHSVRTGEAAYRVAHGRDLWEEMAEDPVLTESFDVEMQRHARAIVRGLVHAREWASVRRLVDVGGGTGELSRGLAAAVPTMDVTLVEYADAARRASAALVGSEVAERYRVVEGSFFEPLPSGGDAYLLAWVLHDWPDREAVRILVRCRQAVSISGRVLVIEKRQEVEKDTDLDLRMLTFFGGRERTTQEYRALGAASDLALHGVTPIGSGFSLFDFSPV
jgi:hypothetical protein